MTMDITYMYMYKSNNKSFAIYIFKPLNPIY